MKWFTGSINEAVATSKSKKAIFVVFVEGKDDTSTQLAQTINATEVSSRLEQEHFVAIRLESGSEAYRFFAQIYQLVPVPSLFFIGENGTPLEIVAGTITAIELVSKIDSVLTKAGKSSKQSSLNLIDAEQKATAISSSSNNNVTENATASNINDNNSNPNIDVASTITESVITDSTSDNKDVIENATKTTTLLNTENQDNNEASKKNVEAKEAVQNKELTAEEKIERARQLIELQRKQRLEEEEKKEREREIERRKMGQDVQKMRKMQQDLEIKLAHEERVREKAAEAAAREKVRQQIAQDKLERKQKELALQQMQQQQCQEQPKHIPSSTASNNATVTRIQFRLPSGNFHTGQFEPTSTLRTLRTYVTENIELPFRQFAMSISFPRRELTNEENDKTLIELELVPSAVILILPLKNVNSNLTTAVTSAQDVGFFSRFIWSFFTPVIRIYNYVVGYFFGTNGDTNQRGNSGGDAVEATNNSDRAISPNRQNVVQSSGLFRRYLGNQGGTTIRAQGNIHRLHSGGDDNDENNTWNGNSTQQM
ncbi:UBX domain-containing protein 2 [Camponotus floridanus]|uniref:UBX domain-containing protein 4 n=1 Tax=Camponotus floridanus TaxID=104421 RepID=E2ASF2_CAMFO|nr:UBX domain-containing protein 4 isoform X1 [Camponotus floridanus]EFN63618.1 UBX domain-containing protein 2 [Camponotus floridanus]